MSRFGRSLLAGFVCSCAAEMLAAGDSTPAYGLASDSSYVVTAWDMESVDGSSTWTQTANGHRYVTSGIGQLVAGVRVPQGAQIETLTLEACDTSIVGNVSFTLFRFDTEGGAGVPLATVESGAAFDLGCDRFRVDLPVPETVDNGFYRYLLEGGNDMADGSTTIGAVRVYYRLRVSPAPFGASFNDVPVSDPAFQFVEALHSSGITSGCGNGNFCPDAPLTRRQMAVFLAKALGLHWPEYPNPN